MNRQTNMCTIKSCPSKAVSQGYCFDHYAKLVAPGFGTCSFGGCVNKIRKDRFCEKHTETIPETP